MKGKPPREGASRNQPRRPLPGTRAPKTLETPLPKRLDEELRRAARPASLDDARAWMSKVLRAQTDGDVAETRRAAIRAKQAAPRAPSVREALGVASFKAEEWHEAAQELLAYRRFTGARDHDAIIAECYRRQGKPDRALELLSDLPRDPSENGWSAALVVRADAFTDKGMVDTALAILEAAFRTAKTQPARATLKAAHQRLRAP